MKGRFCENCRRNTVFQEGPVRRCRECRTVQILWDEDTAALKKRGGYKCFRCGQRTRRRVRIDEGKLFISICWDKDCRAIEITPGNGDERVEAAYPELAEPVTPNEEITSLLAEVRS